MGAMKEKMIDQMNLENSIQHRVLKPGYLSDQIFKGESIRALSWKEPFCTLMNHEKIETRTWYTEYRGLVLMCTSKKSYDGNQLINICGERQFDRVLELLNYLDNNFWCGYAINIGTLVGCRPMELKDEDDCFVKYYPDLWCHIYRDVHPIEPIAWKGVQKWLKVSKHIVDIIKIKS